MQRGQLFAGTSGFAYPKWKPDFYPKEVAAKNFLAYYSRRLNSVEINYTFRRMPAAATLEAWVAATPPGFLFCVKGHMRITHILRLKNASQATDLFLRSIDPLRSARRLGTVLFQLPPNLQRDTALLGGFLELLPPDIRFTIEFRHASWFQPEVYELLEERGVSLCLAESEKLEAPEKITAGFAYFRLRKPEYTAQDREAVSLKARELLAKGTDLFVFFKHEDTPEGALYAEELLQRASGRSLPEEQALRASSAASTSQRRSAGSKGR
jgi:uncharacterized protein YecE (DUF72 family)